MNQLKTTTVITLILALALLMPSTTKAQTLPAGVYNVPGNLPLIADNQSIGSNTTVNLLNGGIIGEFFQAGTLNGSDTNIEVNIFDGNVGSFFTANAGSVINIFGGTLQSEFLATSGSEVNISGGSISGVDPSSVSAGAQINIVGGAISSELNISGTVSLSGGTLQSAEVQSGGVLNVSGGSIRNDIHVISGGVANILGGTDVYWIRSSAGGEVNLLSGLIDLDNSYFENSIVNIVAAHLN